MKEPFYIKKVAVLGAGVMGAQIAAQCLNAGIETVLFDLAAKEGSANALVNKAITHLKQLKPSPLATKATIDYLTARNYEQNLDELAECDLIIEAIAERLDWKEALYQRIAPHINQQALLVSNTSGLSINTLADVLPKALHARFCGVHFFNPPRYMHLAELIPALGTSSQMLDNLETWLTSTLGKGVVRAKDTPNFIANRIGVFSLLTVLHHASAMEMGFDEVDALTGTLIGRPKSATFRTMDVVGLDTMQHVVNTMKEQLKEDPWHRIFELPSWLLARIEAGDLGQKSGQGVYRKTGKTIEVFDAKLGAYRPAQAEVSAELKTIMKIADPAARMQALFASTNRQAQFLTAYYRDLFHYCAYHLEAIANTARDVDLALRWGFGWGQGPFEIWQLAGLAPVAQAIEKAIAAKETLAEVALPQWVHSLDVFFNEKGAYSPQNRQFIPRSALPVYERQLFPERVLGEPARSSKTVFENEGVRLWHLKDDVAVVSFKSKANTIGQPVLDGLHTAIERAEREFQGLIVYQPDATNFSSGADLRAVYELILANKMDALEGMIAHFQEVVMRIKYAAVPVIAALRGRALGGGCELMLHCTEVVAAFESYPGLVEAGVGLIPAGGGCKEMAMRAAHSAQDADLMLFLTPYFQQIAMAEVSGSAPDAALRGYLRASDCWVMNKDEVLFASLARIKALKACNYQAPLNKTFKAAGREGHARLRTGLVNWLQGGFISEHDYYLVDQLAYVLCGGEVNQGELIDEKWILKLEKQAFMHLAGTPLSQARIAHLLETGKPLRN
ncbi:MAG: 3-hydroxyacyl-CoA dehydrogenase NAD-binding domain-containing protein [Tatlockia sp.]|jgi:3-hydroxyacyl-CoA dehydrogenase